MAPNPIATLKKGLVCSLNMQLRLEETRNLKNTHITSHLNRSWIYYSNEVFAVRRVFWAESDQNWSDPLRSDQTLLRIFLTPNGRDRAKFSEQILIRNTKSDQIWADLSRLNSDQIPSMSLSRIRSELNLSPSSINLLKKCQSQGLNLGPTSI